MGWFELPETLSPSERSLRARLAAQTMHAQNDSRVTSAPARAAAEKRFLDLVDPGRVLPEAERLRRAECAKKAHFTRMAYLSARARRKRAS
jgi:hypothetical protein